jgi:hypothetical protein
MSVRSGTRKCAIPHRAGILSGGGFLRPVDHLLDFPLERAQRWIVGRRHSHTFQIVEAIPEISQNFIGRFRHYWLQQFALQFRSGREHSLNTFASHTTPAEKRGRQLNCVTRMWMRLAVNSRLLHATSILGSQVYAGLLDGAAFRSAISPAAFFLRLRPRPYQPRGEQEQSARLRNLGDCALSKHFKGCPLNIPGKKPTPARQPHFVNFSGFAKTESSIRLVERFAARHDEPSPSAPDKSLGLSCAKNRCSWFNGRRNSERQPSLGTTVRAWSVRSPIRPS